MTEFKRPYSERAKDIESMIKLANRQLDSNKLDNFLDLYSAILDTIVRYPDLQKDYTAKALDLYTKLNEPIEYTNEKR